MSTSNTEPAPEDIVQMEEEPEEDEEDLEDELEEDEDEEDMEEDLEDDEGLEEAETATVGRRSGRGLTLKTLLKANVLQPGEGYMNINYLGNKFKGDLLADGRIRSQETSKIFSTPSAWAIFCKKIVNPDKKSGCGWASVRYRGKKLDAYKNNWYRQKRLEFEREGEENDDDTSITDSDGGGLHEHQEVVDFEVIGARHPNHDMNLMVEVTSFQSLGRMQPFNVTMSSSAMAVIDVHAHLTTTEVVGYLAGQWDVNNHNLIVSHAMPVLCRLGDNDKGPIVEQTLYNEMRRLNLSLVGWYHTHPHAVPLPTLRDIDAQLDYEMKMKGYNDASYTPCVGIISSPYHRDSSNAAAPGKTNGYWVMPPPEHKPQEYGRPMNVQYNIVQDAFIPKEALIQMRDCVAFYMDGSDFVSFTDVFLEKVTYWAKLKASLNGRVPSDHIIPLLQFLAKLLNIKMHPDEMFEIKKPDPPIESSNSENANVKIEVISDQTASESSSSAVTPVPATISAPPPPIPAATESQKPSKSENVSTEKTKSQSLENSDDSDMSVPSAPQLQALAEAHLQPMERSPGPEEISLISETKATIVKPVSTISQEPLPPPPPHYTASSKLQSMLQEDQNSKLQSLLHDKQQATKIQNFLQEQIQASKLQSMLQEKHQAAQLQTLIQEQHQVTALQNALQEHQSSKLQSLLQEQQEAINLHTLIQAQQQSGSLHSFLQEQQSNALQNLIKEQHSSSLQSYLEDHGKKMQSMIQDQKKPPKYSNSGQESQSSKGRGDRGDVPESKLKYPPSLLEQSHGTKLQSMLQEKHIPSKYQHESKEVIPIHIPETTKSMINPLSLGHLPSQQDEAEIKSHLFIQPTQSSSKGLDKIPLFSHKLPIPTSKANPVNLEVNLPATDLTMQPVAMDSSDPLHPIPHFQHRTQTPPTPLFMNTSVPLPSNQPHQEVDVRKVSEDQPMDVDETQ